MKATDIKWDVDRDDVYEKLDSMNPKDAAIVLNITPEEYLERPVSACLFFCINNKK